VRFGTVRGWPLGYERWYLDDLVYPQLRESEWDSIDIDVASSTFRLAKARPEVGPTLPITGGASLPKMGVFTAFGVFVDEARGRVRIDNITLIDPSVANGVAPDPVPTRVGTPVARPTDTEQYTDPDHPGFLGTATPTSVPAPATPTLAPGVTPSPGPSPTPTPQVTATPTPTPTSTAFDPATTYSFCPVNGKKRKKAVVGRALWKQYWGQ
jgi:hypothetical protein